MGRETFVFGVRPLGGWFVEVVVGCSVGSQRFSMVSFVLVGGGASGYQDQLSSVRASEYSGGLDPSGRCAAAAAVKSIVDFVRSRPREVGPF